MPTVNVFVGVAGAESSVFQVTVPPVAASGKLSVGKLATVVWRIMTGLMAGVMAEYAMTCLLMGLEVTRQRGRAEGKFMG